MYKHTDLLRLVALNKADAIERAQEFLSIYDKKNVNVISVQGTRNIYDVFVEFYDKYEDCIYSTKDFSMYKHVDVLKLTANNESHAKGIAEEFLLRYNKKKIYIGSVQEADKNNIYTIPVEYYDKYEECAIYSSEDFVPMEQPEEAKTLTYEYSE